MAITGNLRTMQLSELLQWLSMGQKTGTLVVRGTPGEKRIYFQGGRIISSSSTIEREYLGHFLVAYGHITTEELTRAMEVQEESKILLGKILVMIGAISEANLTELIKLKAAETIYDIFLWTEGAFEFIDGEVPKWPMVPISADVTGIVMEGLRRYDEWARIKERIRTLAEVPVLVAPVAADDIPERERLVLAAIDGQTSLAEIGASTHNPDFHVAKFVFDLLESGHVELLGAKSDGAEPADDLDLSEDPFETVFEDATTSPFDLPAAGSSGGTPQGGGFAPANGSGWPAAAAMAAATVTPPPRPYQPPPAPPSAASVSASSGSVPVPEAAKADFARFLRRGPDSGAMDVGRGARGPDSPERLPSQPAPVAPRPAPAAVQAPVPPAQPAPAGPAPRVLGSGSTPSALKVAGTSVPKLIKPMEELMNWSFTPNEAFILSRINGTWDVRSIAKISPFPEGEVLRVFQKLHEGGVIAWG
ncbi:MAG: DUF4388 domain-containing protein [Acidobacteria bacterium]|nr:DUF4388 domain-containing protein [Acidobacteriota bacterium]